MQPRPARPSKNKMANDARLQFLIELEDQVSGRLAAVNGAFSGIQDQVEAMKPTFEKMATAGTAALAGIGAGVWKVVDAFSQSQSQLALTDGIIDNFSKKTLATFGGTTDAAGAKARAFGTDLQRMGGIGDEIASTGLVKLAQITGDYSKALDAAKVAADLSAFKQIDYGTAVDVVGKVLAGNTSILTRYGIELGKDATVQEAMNALTEKTNGLYEKQGKTIDGQTKIMKQSFGDLEEALGKAFVPALTEVLNKIAPVIQRFTEWADKNPDLVVKIVAVSAAIAGLVALLGFLGLALGPIIATIGVLAAVVTFVTSPLGLLILAVTALVAAIAFAAIEIAKHWDEIKAWTKQRWDDILAYLEQKWAAITTSIKNAWNAITQFFGTTWANMRTIVVTALEFIVGTIILALDAFIPDWQKRLADTLQAFTDMWDAMRDAVLAFIDWIIPILTTALGKLQEIWSSVWGAVSGIFTSVWGNIQSTFNDIVDGITSKINGLLATVMSVYDKIVGPVSAIYDAAAGAVHAGIKAAGDVYNAAAGAAGAAVQAGAGYIMPTPNEEEDGGDYGGDGGDQPMAFGGIVTRPMRALLGEAGMEAVIPLNRLAGAGMGGQQINITVTGNTLLDRDAAMKIGSQLVKYLKDNIRL